MLPAIWISATLVASPPAPRNPDVAGKHPVLRRWLQIGNATWYGRRFQGKPTASGETFDMHALTCAHRTLPLGSWLRVTNLRNRHSTFVRVTDRGPFRPDAVVDLSYAAAQRLGVLGKSRVSVETVRPDDPEVAQALVDEISRNSDTTAISPAIN